jgi:hypothetical protein
MNRFTKIVFLQFLIICQIAESQTIVRSSMGCFGATFAENGFMLRQTAGQSYGTDVLKNDAIMLRQGFQQPLAQRSNTINIRQIDFSISPNPAKIMAMIRFAEEIPECVVVVRDLSGIPLIQSRETFIQSKWLDLKDLKPGVYFVTVIGGNGKGSSKLIVTR